MSSDVFSSLEIDAIGEILNISLGASATAVSTMLSRRVDITTPKVQVLSLDEFEFTSLEPAVGVEITYVSGLQGSNIMLLKKHDVKVIVEILMGMEIPDEEFELNEMNVSAICEVMNQMMGSSSTALSEFLGEVVNISTPVSFEIKDEDEFKQEHFSNDERMVVVRFQLKIENVMESEFMNVMPTNLAKKLVSAFGLTEEMVAEADNAAVSAPQEAASSSSVMSQDEIEKMLASSMIQSVPEPAQTGGSTMLSQEDIEKMLASGDSGPAPAPSGGVMSQEEIEKMLAGGVSAAPAPAAAPSGGVMSQEEIEKLLGGAGNAEPQPQATPQAAPQPMPYPQAQPGMQPQMMQPQMQPQMMQPGMQPQMMQPGMQPQMMQPQMPPMQPYYMQPPEQPRMIQVQPLVHQPLAGAKKTLGEEKAENLNLIMGVPLEISVEIGRTKRLVKEILEFAQGSLVVLDKLAGEQVDLYVNGQCIAKGDVVVVDDNFGIRVTEIIKKPDIAGLEL